MIAAAHIAFISQRLPLRVYAMPQILGRLSDSNQMSDFPPRAAIGFCFCLMEPSFRMP